MIEEKGVHYVLHEGATQEVAFEWDDLVHMCRLGQLTPETLVFDPEERQWKRAGDTVLADLFPVVDEAPQEREDPDQRAQAEAEYSAVLEEIRAADAPGDLFLRAAALALQLGNRNAARAHYQAALDLRPYDGRVVAEIKRSFSGAELGNFRFLERVEPFWEDPEAFVRYPFGRGLVYLVVPAVVLFALTFFPRVGLVAIPVAFLWLQEIMKSFAAGHSRPPLWHGLVKSPMSAVVTPLGAGTALAATILLPFFAAAQIAVLIGDDESNAFLYIQKSPLMIALLFTVTAVYVPAACMLVARSAWQAIDPRQVVSAIARMERDYIFTLVFILALTGLWALASWLLGWIPIAGRLVSCAAGVFAFVLAGAALGNLCSRFKDQIG